MINVLSLCGHFTFTKDQLKKVWAVLLQMKCERFVFRSLHRNMPDGWGQDFVAVLPSLKIRKLYVAPVGSFDNAQMVLDALKKNYTVEEFHVRVGGESIAEEVRLVCALNWAGRRIERLGPNDFNVALWPKVLQRINDRECQVLNKKETKLSKTDILFHLLKENVQRLLENDQRRGNANRKRKSPPE